ncbi:hypothetical protein [Gracilimonas sp.]|uniref:hypothetical protein n=1 Tax=Gracilimonas sp. TaxID=1974203 RepID=UPI003BA924CA
MGRAMIILACGAIFTMGIMQMGMQDRKVQITKVSSSYANDIQARNKAFTAVQIAMDRINESNGSWHPEENSPWIQEIDGDSISLYYELFEASGASGTFGVLESDTVKMYSTSWYQDPLTGARQEMQIISLFTKNAMHFVPEFRSALSFATNDFTFSAGGSSLVSGNDASGTCSDRPALAVQNNYSYLEATSGGLGNIESDSTNVAIDSELSYQPVDQLVARLAQMDDVQKISGNYKGSLGSSDDPGVFFVEENAKLTGGISEGYGIMVVRSNGYLEYDSAGVELDLAGNFKFNGLVIFEDAYNMDGRGTPTIKGSVLVGKKDEDTGNKLDVDLNGNITIQYDCEAEKYAQVASANKLKQNRYRRLSTFE